MTLPQKSLHTIEGISVRSADQRTDEYEKHIRRLQRSWKKLQKALKEKEIKLIVGLHGPFCFFWAAEHSQLDGGAD